MGLHAAHEGLMCIPMAVAHAATAASLSPSTASVGGLGLLSGFCCMAVLQGAGQYSVAQPVMQGELTV